VLAAVTGGFYTLVVDAYAFSLVLGERCAQNKASKQLESKQASKV
jgi:hypothetical protein